MDTPSTIRYLTTIVIVRRKRRRRNAAVIILPEMMTENVVIESGKRNMINTAPHIMIITT